MRCTRPSCRPGSGCSIRSRSSTVTYEPSLTGPGYAGWTTTNAILVLDAFTGYLGTILAGRRREGVTFDVLDVVGKSGFGIGSAGLPAYNVLIEGFTQALDNDVVLTLKQGNVAAPSRVVDDRTCTLDSNTTGTGPRCLSAPLQAHADRFLGWATLPVNGRPTGFVVSEYSPYQTDLAWDEITEPDQIGPLVEQLDGRPRRSTVCPTTSPRKASSTSPWKR
jgi:hypothetical protein